MLAVGTSLSTETDSEREMAGEKLANALFKENSGLSVPLVTQQCFCIGTFALSGWVTLKV